MTAEAREPAPAAGDQAPPDLPRHRRTSERLRQAAAYPPPGPFRAQWWRSPVRGPWLTSYFGSILLVGIPLLFLTGLVSYASYNPRLAGNDTTPGKGILGFYLFSWVTNPSWVYRVSQGTHVILGLTLVPIVLAKLWSVIPKLFEWPGVRSVAHGLERLSLMLVVGGALFEFATGIADIEYYYPWKFDFYEAHLYGAWVFIVGFVVHVCLKLPTMWRSLQRYSLREIFTTPLARTRPEPGDGHGLVASHPSPPTISRRGVLGLVGGSAAAVFLLTAGGTVRVLRPLALLTPRARSQGTGPHPEANDFEVNRVFAATGIPVSETGESWRLVLSGPRTVSLSRAELMVMPLTTEVLPIACVEG
jgi:DMSO/TMAO reductase YedYZ molybdopterin-dependent catalytic subunit